MVAAVGDVDSLKDNIKDELYGISVHEVSLTEACKYIPIKKLVTQPCSQTDMSGTITVWWRLSSIVRR